MKPLLLVILLLMAMPRSSFATWGFTATIYEHCSTYVTPPRLPPITGFETLNECITTRNQVLAIVVSSSNCTVGYNCSPCTGADASSSSGFVSISSTSAGVFSPLSGGVSALNPVGPDSGHPTFSPHYSAAPQAWQQEAAARTQAFPSLSATVMPISSVQYQNRFAANMEGICGHGGCGRRGGTGSGYANTGNSTTYSQPDEPERRSDDPGVNGDPIPPISGDSGQPIGGAGVTYQDKPDTPPPPNPEHLNPGDKCRKGWWYNSATHNCYGGGYSDCLGDNSAGPHRCYQP